MSFSFESLDVYKRSLNLVEVVEDLCRKLKGQITYSMIDQLSRAALSVPLNIAEGCGRWNIKERKQFLRIARGSVFEIVPILQILLRKGCLETQGFQSMYDALDVLSRMLNKLIQSADGLNTIRGERGHGSTEYGVRSTEWG